MVRACGWTLAIIRFYVSDTLETKHGNKINVKLHVNDTSHVYIKRTPAHTYIHRRTYYKYPN